MKFLIFLVIVVGVFGMKMTMMTDEHGTMMVGCPFMSETGSLCQMTIFDHIAKWQSVFVATISFDALLLLLVVVIFAGYSRIVARALAPPDTVFRYRAPPDAPLWRPLLFAFSRGIIQPKLYTS